MAEPTTTTADLIARLERLAHKYEANKLPDHARGVHHALREVRAFFAPVELRSEELDRD